MKKIISKLLVLCLVAGMVAGCSSSKQTETVKEEKKEVIVFAAASMTETLTKIEEKYEAAHSDIDLIFTFDSSGTLKTQIENASPCDVFISASPKQMNAIDASKDREKNPDGLDFVVRDSRFNLLENKVVLVVPEGNPAGIESFDALAVKLSDGIDNGSDIKMAMGDADVPVGQYTQKILKFYEISEEDLAKANLVTYGSNVKEVTKAVSEAAVSCGVIYATDAVSAGLKYVDEATAEMCGQVIYPAAVINTGSQPEAAADFLAYLTGEEASRIFESVGFTALAK